MDSDDDWLRIGEVARRSGLTLRTLRHYDDLGLLVPSGRTGGDYRLYAPDDLRRLLDIQHLKSLGLSLDEVAAALDDPAFDASAALERHIAVVEERLAAERELLARLRSSRTPPAPAGPTCSTWSPSPSACATPSPGSDSVPPSKPPRMRP